MANETNPEIIRERRQYTSEQDFIGGLKKAGSDVATVAELYSDSDAIDAINNDPDHGSTATHNYYSDADALSAVNNDSDHGSTASHNYTTANDLNGYGLNINGNGELFISRREVQIRQVNIPLTEIPDGDNAVGLRQYVPLNEEIRILDMGVQNDAGSAPTGLDIVVRDETNALDVASQNAKSAEGSPLATSDENIDVVFRIENSTGSTQNASGHVAYTMET